MMQMAKYQCSIKMIGKKLSDIKKENRGSVLNGLIKCT